MKDGKLFMRILVGATLVAGLVISGCGDRRATAEKTLDEFVSILTPPLSQRLTEIHNPCFDVAIMRQGRCYLYTHYLTAADADSLQEMIEAQGLSFSRSTSVGGDNIFTEINLQTSHSLNADLTGQSSDPLPRPSTMQWVIKGQPEMIITWYETSALENVTFDREVLRQNIVSIAVRSN